jgi:hypothetical protein
MRCRWCGHPVQRKRGEWFTADGQLCSPTLRGPICVFWFYRTYGIDPLQLKFHDSSCTCQATIMHSPVELAGPAPFAATRRGPGDQGCR